MVLRNILIKGGVYVDDKNNRLCHSSCSWLKVSGRFVRRCFLFDVLLTMVTDRKEVFAERCPACWEAERIYNETKSLLDGGSI